MNTAMCVKDPTVFLQKMLENAYDEGDMAKVQAMSAQIDAIMLRQMAEANAAAADAM